MAEQEKKQRKHFSDEQIAKALEALKGKKPRSDSREDEIRVYDGEVARKLREILAKASKQQEN